MIDITVDQAKEILAELTNGTIDGISAGKNGRAWLSGEFDLAQLEAICVLVRAEAGTNAQGAKELIDYWRSEDM
jgi:tRNA U34 5-carboxymethylaminomethyl modifying GTPase MnmE/TrmE